MHSVKAHANCPVCYVCAPTIARRGVTIGSPITIIGRRNMLV